MSCPRASFACASGTSTPSTRARRRPSPASPTGKPDGMAGTLCNGIAKPAGWKARDGRLWFCTTKGLVVVDPNIKVNETAPAGLHRAGAGRQEAGERVRGRVGERAARRPLAALRSPFRPGRGELEFRLYRPGFPGPGTDPLQVPAGRRGFGLGGGRHAAGGALQQHLSGPLSFPGHRRQ